MLITNTTHANLPAISFDTPANTSTAQMMVAIANNNPNFIVFLFNYSKIGSIAVGSVKHPLANAFI